MIELVDLKSWKKQKEIIDELYTKYNININSRKWRIEVEKWNKLWSEGNAPYYITHSNSLGFKATIDYKEAKIGRNDYLSRLKANRKNILYCDEGFKKMFNYKIDFESGEVV